MSDFFRKLNVLVKSSVNELLGDDWAVGSPRRRPLTPEKLGPNIDREIAELRKRINEALEHENQLQARLQSLRDEVARWDGQANEAVLTGNDAVARYAIEQMQRAQQQLAMTEADLREHKYVTQELVLRVNTLDAAVADARRARAEAAAPSEEAAPDIPSQEAEKSSQGRLLSDVLRDAREKIAEMGDKLSAQAELQTSPVEDNLDEEAIEEDLARRRQRLSK